MEQFNNFLILLDSNLSGSWWFPALLTGTGIFFTIYLGFPVYDFKSALKLFQARQIPLTLTAKQQDFRHLQLLCLELLARVI